MPSPGRFALYARAVPPLPAGDYRLDGTQTMPSVPAARFEAYVGHLRVTSPRFQLPPDQILSTWPPANSEGAYESRLPQVVLRRRTLPWERRVRRPADVPPPPGYTAAAPPPDEAHPWLALVVIAEGEGELTAERPIAECVTPGVRLEGPNDVATGVALVVPQTVVDRVFPTVNDLLVLAHVREVDLADTELALGDDDGFMAVVLANRLPQFDRVNCAPVRYLACLVNLEGQLDALPLPTPPSPTFPADAVVFDVRAAWEAARTGQVVHADLAVMEQVASPAAGGAVAPGAGPVVPPAVRAADRLAGDGVAPAARAGATAAAPRPAQRTAAPGVIAAGTAPATHAGSAGEWQLRATATVAEVAATAAGSEQAGRLVRDAMKEGFRVPIGGLRLPERVFRFPVLAHWSFTCTGAGSFETLMQELDVGLLGTLPPEGSARARPECAPPVPGDAPPPEPPSRPAPEFAETGHVGLPHLTRRGDRTRAWYRGPLAPHLTERDAPDDGGRLPLAHTSDQLRRVVPDGREELGLAAAFEIGRLLALSQPSVVSALMRWRREAFGAERARRLTEAAIDGAAILAPVAGAARVAELGQLVGRQFVRVAGERPERVLAPAVPLADAGRPLRFAVGGTLDEVLAAGFRIPLDTLRAARETGAAGMLAAVAVPTAERPERLAVDAGRLRAALLDEAARLTDDALPTGRAPDGGLRGFAARALRAVRPGTAPAAEAAPPEPDALDRLLDDAARRRGGEPR